MTIAAYQGVDGAYSQLVLNYLLHDSGEAFETRGLPSLREVATETSSGRAAIGIFPTENALGGTVREAYDLLREFHLKPLREIFWQSDHRLLAHEGAKRETIREVHAHPLILAECGKFLSSMPLARIIPCEDTGLAAREVSRRGGDAVAAIGPPAAAGRYGLVEIANTISDYPHNFTRFVAFRGKHSPETALDTVAPQRKTTVFFSIANTVGALARCLDILAAAGISMSKLESKPSIGDPRDGTFYLDFEGDASEPHVAAALEQVRANTQSLEILGSYNAHVGSPIGKNDVAPPPFIADLAHAWTPTLPAAASVALPRVSREHADQRSRFRIGNVTVGDGHFVVIAGPCSIESREQIIETARAVQAAGAVMLRGGAFKPRTSPYAFQGLGWEAVDLISEAGRATGMPTISEVMSVEQIDRMAGQIDILQIGARNMQNFDLLKAVGRTGHPVLLKRGFSATIDELLHAAEYILAEGNPNVILCERGIRTFEPATRNTLDLSAIPVLRERSHLPVFVDPSHGVGVSRWIGPMCYAAKAAGAHGLLVEVHPNPPEAKSDKEQALTPAHFAAIMARLARIPTFDREPVA